MITNVLKYKSDNILLLYILWVVRYYRDCYLELDGIERNAGFVLEL